MNHEHSLPAPQPFCPLFEPLLPLLSQGQLDVSAAVATRDHVATCAWCQGQLRDFDFLRDALRRLDEHETDVDDASSYLPLLREEIREEFSHAPANSLTTQAPGILHERRAMPQQQGRFSLVTAIA